MDANTAIQKCEQFATGLEQGGLDEDALAIRTLISLVRGTPKPKLVRAVMINGERVSITSWNELLEVAG